MNLSGVIVVVIVALWGSLLIPALVRKHDTVTEVRSVDRFSYALRILSRRTPYTPGRRDVLVQRKSAEERRPVVSPAPDFVANLPGGRPAPSARVAARRGAVAAKRRRTLVALLLALVLCVTLAVRSGGRWWLTVGISAVLLVMYVTNLRTEAQQQQAIVRRRAQARRRAGRAAAPARRTSAPVRRHEPVVAETPAGSPMTAETLPDGSWAPVPVTLPTYVTKPVVAQPSVAPPTGSWYDGVLAEQRAGRYASGGDVYDQMSDDEVADGGYLGLSRDDDGLYGADGLDAIIERRRAVND
ncbi:MAG: hypothetical protein QOI76_879 [Frankiales bacterium]|jgi:hypothetical protein|nr:hypothetical protein [Frankiales bacterium]